MVIECLPTFAAGQAKNLAPSRGDSAPEAARSAWQRQGTRTDEAVNQPFGGDRMIIKHDFTWFKHQK